MRPIVQSNCFLAFGIVIGVISIAMMASFNAIYKKVLENVLVIDQDNDIFDTFTHTSSPMYLDFYFFNVTNADDIQNKGAKPILQEVGPYKYLEDMQKVNYSFDHDSGTFKYKQTTTYYFDSKTSVGSEDDVIITLNPVLLLLGAGLYDNENEMLVNIIWNKLEEFMNLFGEFKVGEMLFDGYTITIPPDTPFNYPGHKGSQGTLYDFSCDVLHHCMPSLKEYKFSYFYGANGSNDGLYEVFTGENGMDNYLFVDTWNGEKALNYWGYNGTRDDPYCNMINGTDGTQFPPGVMKDDLIQIFVTDLCRSIDFVFDSEIKVLDIVDTLRFVAPKSAFESGRNNANNLCYCVPVPDRKDPCLNNSMLDLAPCLNAPIVLSTPHFYEGEDADINSVEGLSPSKEKHETFLDIEPTTGVVLRGSKRIQLNLPLKRYGSLSTFQHVPELIFPILWADENAVIPEDDANDLNDALTVPYLIVYIVFSITLFVAVIFIIIGAILRHRIKKNTKAGLLTKN